MAEILELTMDEHEREMIPSFHTVRGSRDFVLQSHLRVCEQDSEDAVKTLRCDLDVQYGEHDKECIDIFYPEGDIKGIPVFVFIHGGYWVHMSRQLSRGFLKSLPQQGCVSVVVGYQQAPQVTLPKIIENAVLAIQLSLKKAKEWGSSGVYICGHSAGAHMAAMALSRNWKESYGQASHLIKGVLLLSGVLDVRQIIGTENNDHLGLTREEAWELSPLRVAAELANQCTEHKCDVICVVGGHESKTFIKMSRDYYEALQNNGLQSGFVLEENVDHFNLIEKLTDTDYLLTKTILSFMGIASRDIGVPQV